MNAAWHLTAQNPVKIALIYPINYPAWDGVD